MKPIAALAALGLAVHPAWGHEGHDHGSAAPEVKVQAAPRAAAESEAFELVAVLDGTAGLTLYLDRHASNEPVAGARIELESGAFRAVAQARGAGVYGVPAGAFAKPGKYPLTLTVQAGDETDLLAATLEVPPPAAPASGATAMPAWVWAAGGGALLGLAAYGLARRRIGRQP